MISYTQDVLERQSLSEVKMGRGSPICERVRVKRLWKIMFLNVKLQKICQSHHLQCITSSKDSEKLEKSLCGWDKALAPLLDAHSLRALRQHCITH